MHLVANVGLKSKAKAMVEPGVLHRAMGWLVDLAGGAWLGSSRVKARRLRVVETLSLGAKKQLLLVTCDGEKYLVGTGAESVQTIMRVGRRVEIAGLRVLTSEQGESN